jgi:hypothetical protein
LIWTPEDQGRKAQNNLEYLEEDAKGKNIAGVAVVMIGLVPIAIGSDHKTRPSDDDYGSVYHRNLDCGTQI